MGYITSPNPAPSQAWGDTTWPSPGVSRSTPQQTSGLAPISPVGCQKPFLRLPAILLHIDAGTIVFSFLRKELAEVVGVKMLIGAK